MGVSNADDRMDEPAGPGSDSPQVTTDSGGDPVSPSAENSEADALEAAESKATENWDKYLRATAELDNVRKRAQRDIEKAHKFSIERFAHDLLAVADSLELGIEAATDSEDKRLLEGSRATLKLLQQVFERFGVVQEDPLGEPFNPEFHEAMTMQPSADAEPGSVIVVVQRGYRLNGRLLRPARVVVAAAPVVGGE